MIKVPGFLLRRLYVKGSLRNTSDGFEFRLKNSLGSGYAHGLLPVKVNGEAIPMEQATFAVEGQVLLFTEVSKEKPASLTMNREATISIKGRTLEEGPHKLSMGFIVGGLGELRFDLTDNLSKS
ncbi:MAG: hypothetical protein IIC82_09485 [Chloroflexi bacterium]|nr:hypothetical protein [Chloroflexota bacterium]